MLTVKHANKNLGAQRVGCRVAEKCGQLGPEAPEVRLRQLGAGNLKLAAWFGSLWCPSS